MEVKSPPVSVIMSVYNGEKYLRESVESILNQTFCDYEFIIVNDGSTDNSEKIILAYGDNRIRYIKRDNHGLSASLNHAINISSGIYIARMDADDISYMERLAVQYDFLQNNQDFVMTGSNADIIDMRGNYLCRSDLPLEHCDIIAKLDQESPFYHSSVFYRKAIFTKCGGYFEPVRHHVEDFILWNKFAKYGKLQNISEPLIKYRMVPDALTNRNAKKTRIMKRIAKEIIAGNPISENEMEVFHSDEVISRNSRYGSYYCRIGCIYLYKVKNNRLKALSSFISALKYNPLSIHALFFFFLSLMPAGIINKWKGMRGIS